jgi:outer membrane protein TolC
VQPQVGLSWTLYPGGKNIYEMLAAKQRQQSSDSLLKETYQEQLAGAAEDYYKLLAAHLKKGVVVRSLLQAEEQVKLNQAKVKVGSGLPLDLSRANTNYAQQTSVLLQAETGIIQAEQNLLNRLNLDSMIHLVPDVAEAQKRELVTEEKPIQTWLGDALKTHPSIQTMQADLKALGLDYKATRADLIPSVTLRAYTNGTGPDWNGLTRTNFGGFAVNMNLLQNMGLQIPLQMQERKKLVEQKTLDLKGLSRNIESQVMTAFLSSQNYKSSIDAAQKEVDSAQESYDLAVGRFKAGYGINLDVLDAGTALETARNNLVQAILNYNQSQVQLLHALGQVSPETLLSGARLEGKTAHDDTEKTTAQ